MPHPRESFEKVGIDRDHRCDLIQSYREARSATSRPGGSPPGATAHLNFRHLSPGAMAVPAIRRYIVMVFTHSRYGPNP